MDQDFYHEVLHRVLPRISKLDYRRKPLEPGLKLVVTLRHLATGASYKSLRHNFRVSDSSICLFVPEVCNAIHEEHRDEMFGFPETQEGRREMP